MPEFEEYIEQISRYHASISREIDDVSAKLKLTDNNLYYIFVDFIIIDVMYAFKILFEHSGLRVALFVKIPNKSTGTSYMTLVQSSTFYDKGPEARSFAEGEGFCGNVWAQRRPIAGSKYLPFLYRIIKDSKYQERDILESTRSFLCLPIARESGIPNALYDVVAVLVIDSERRRDFMMTRKMASRMNSHLRIIRAVLLNHVENHRYKEPS